MDFIPLHIYSGYTFLNSGILFKKLMPFLKANNISTVGLSDYNVMHGFPSFNDLCQKNNIRPIFGLDLKVENNLFSLYVKDENGYRNLCQISTFLEKRGGICKDFSEIKEISSNLICVISTKSSKIFTHINEDLFKNNLLNLKNIFPDFYIGLEIYDEIDKQKSVLIRQYAEQYDIPCIAFPHIKYLEKKDVLTLKILNAISKDTAIETIDEEIPSYNYFYNNDEINALYDYKDLFELNNLVSKINFSFKVKRGELLHFTEGQSISSKDLLKEEIYKGLEKHNIDLKKNPRYKNRLNKEFLIIDRMGFCDYFLIVQDYVRFAKNNSIPVGPGRGSAAGSLVSYLLDITEVDPLKYSDLIFERFLNPERKSMPDIDIDFSDLDRDKVVDYIVSRYGASRTARVIAFQTIKAKQAIRDVGRVFHYPQEDIEQLSKSIPTTFNQGQYDLDLCEKQIPAFKNLLVDPKMREIVEYAKLIEGFPRQKGLHAAGVIINNKSLLECLPLTTLDDEQYVTQYEKDYLEDQGFLKMDLLGLTALSTIQRTLDLIKQHQHVELKFEDIPYNDPKIYETICSQRTMGVFQLDTSAAKKGISYIQPSKFEEVVDLLALDRPGPMEQIPLYSDRKSGRYIISYPDNSLIPILKSTYGIIIYQEQIMQIARVFAGFSLAEADIFRKAVSKKHASEILKMKEKFVLGAKTNGHQDAVIENIFNLILKFASYGFNKSHSVAYSIISCRMVYLKTYYPLEFYCSILESQYGSNDEKFIKYVSEIKKNNIKILVPNINESTMEFRIYNSSLLMPLTNIGGLPSKVSYSIIQERIRNGKFKDFLDFVLRMYRQKDKITELQVSKLIDAGCFDSLNPNRKQLKMSINSALQYASTLIFQESSLLDNFGLSFTYPEVGNDKKIAMQNEHEVLGIYISDSPFNHIKLNPSIKLTEYNLLKPNVQSTIFGLIINTKVITIKKGKNQGQPMGFIDLQNIDGDVISVTLFSDIYSLYASILDVDKFVLIEGKYDTKNKDRPTFICTNLTYLSEDLDNE